LIQVEHTDAGGGQLNGQWNAVEPAADLGQSWGVSIGHGEIWPHGGGALDEELDRLVLRKPLGNVGT
jgi:hypothetical protein